MSGKQQAGNNGIGFASVLGLIFITLKLIHEIAWPWWWVLSPFWIVAALVLAIFLIVLPVIVVQAALADPGKRRRSARKERGNLR